MRRADAGAATSPWFSVIPMHRSQCLFVPVLLAAVASARAQVDFYYSEVSDSLSYPNRAYGNAIVRWSPGVKSPVAQESRGRSATLAVYSVKCRTVGGLDYLHWYDTRTKAIWRGRDANGNGVVDPTEFQ